MTDLVFFHELGHIVLNQNYLNTILVSSLKNKDENIVPALTQITNNIMEGFCDAFSTYLTSKQYSNDKIITNYELVRLSSYQDYDKQNSTIKPYNVSSVINKLKNTQINDSTIISDLLNLSIENSLTLTTEKLINSQFKFELTENLKLILNNSNLKLESNNDYISILNQELLKYNPIKTYKIKP